MGVWDEARKDECVFALAFGFGRDIISFRFAFSRLHTQGR